MLNIGPALVYELFGRHQTFIFLVELRKSQKRGIMIISQYTLHMLRPPTVCRYADVVVHRLLAAALQLDVLPEGARDRWARDRGREQGIYILS